MVSTTAKTDQQSKTVSEELFGQIIVLLPIAMAARGDRRSQQAWRRHSAKIRIGVKVRHPSARRLRFPEYDQCRFGLQCYKSRLITCATTAGIASCARSLGIPRLHMGCFGLRFHNIHLHIYIGILSIKI